MCERLHGAMSESNFPDIFRVLEPLVAASFSVTPKPHASLGVDAYCRATSPLRRYTDLLLHLQLKSAMRRERPLDRQAIDDMLPYIFFRTLDAQQAEKLVRYEWWRLNQKRLHKSHAIALADRTAERANENPKPFRAVKLHGDAGQKPAILLLECGARVPLVGVDASLEKALDEVDANTPLTAHLTLLNPRGTFMGPAMMRLHQIDFD